MPAATLQHPTASPARRCIEVLAAGTTPILPAARSRVAGTCSPLLGGPERGRCFRRAPLQMLRPSSPGRVFATSQLKNRPSTDTPPQARKIVGSASISRSSSPQSPASSVCRSLGTSMLMSQKPRPLSPRLSVLHLTNSPSSSIRHTTPLLAMYAQRSLCSMAIMDMRIGNALFRISACIWTAATLPQLADMQDYVRQPYQCLLQLDQPSALKKAKHGKKRVSFCCSVSADTPPLRFLHDRHGVQNVCANFRRSAQDASVLTLSVNLEGTTSISTSPLTFLDAQRHRVTCQVYQPRVRIAQRQPICLGQRRRAHDDADSVVVWKRRRMFAPTPPPLAEMPTPPPSLELDETPIDHSDFEDPSSHHIYNLRMMAATQGKKSKPHCLSCVESVILSEQRRLDITPQRSDTPAFCKLDCGEDAFFLTENRTQAILGTLSS